MSDEQEPTCSEILDRLDEYLDGNLAPCEVALASQHLLVCVCCARRMRFEICMLEALKARLRRIKIPPHLRSSIMLRLCLEPDGE